MRSPGRPPGWSREHVRQFWEAIARGFSSEEAAVVVGLSPAVGGRWFRQAGGMATISQAPLSGRYLSFAEREDIALLHAAGSGVCDIARQLDRSPSTISRELRRNAATHSGALEYRASTAQWHADRRWANAWSPEQIANRLPIDFPDDVSMRISHEAICQALYVQGRGALRHELIACLRTGRALRVPRARTRARGKKFISPEIMISEQPAEADDRAVPGHWEGELILGLESSAIGTLVERTTRFTMLLHLPRMEGHRPGRRVHNGPALAGHGAQAVRDAIATSIAKLPEQLRRSLTWDQGAEMAQHAQLRIDTGIAIYFCDPQSPWQRGTNENTNGLLRQYFPKGTDLSRHSPEELAAAAATLNSRPRKTLSWRTPTEAFDDLLRSVVQASVATTP